MGPRGRTPQRHPRPHPGASRPARLGRDRPDRPAREALNTATRPRPAEDRASAHADVRTSAWRPRRTCGTARARRDGCRLPTADAVGNREPPVAGASVRVGAISWWLPGRRELRNRTSESMMLARQWLLRWRRQQTHPCLRRTTWSTTCAHPLFLVLSRLIPLLASPLSTARPAAAYCSRTMRRP